jgi:hypothetical protein
MVLSVKRGFSLLGSVSSNSATQITIARDRAAFVIPGFAEDPQVQPDPALELVLRQKAERAALKGWAAVSSRASGVGMGYDAYTAAAKGRRDRAEQRVCAATRGQPSRRNRGATEPPSGASRRVRTFGHGPSATCGDCGF